jgi:hypothetical protein
MQRAWFQPGTPETSSGPYDSHFSPGGPGRWSEGQEFISGRLGPAAGSGGESLMERTIGSVTRNAMESDRLRLGVRGSGPLIVQNGYRGSVSQRGFDSPGGLDGLCTVEIEGVLRVA